MTAHPMTASHQRLWLALALAIAALYFGFVAALDKLLPRWEGVWDYSHGYLVCGMIAWLLFERVRDRADVAFVPSIHGLIVVAGIAVLYTGLQMIDFTFGMFLTLPLVLLGILWAIGGVALLRTGAAPALLLVFAIPFWDRLGPVLQDIAAVVVRDMLRAVGIPAFSEGHVIRTARAAVEVAAACSGMTFLLASITLCCFYAIAWLRSWMSGLLLLILGVAVAIVSNWLRIFIITVAGHLSDMQHFLIVEDHEFFGWALFSVFMVGLIVFARRLELRGHRVGPSSEEGDEYRRNAALAVSCGVPSDLRSTPTIWSWRAYLIVLLTLALLIAPVLVRPEAVSERIAEPLALEVTQGAEWRLVEPADDWMPQSPNPAAVLRQTFARSGDSVDLYVAFYPVQVPGGKVTSTAHRIAPDWAIVADRRVDHSGWQVREQELVQNGRRRLVWTWFDIGGSRVPSLSQAKLHEILGIVKGDRSGALLAVSTVCAKTCVDGAPRLEAFLTISEKALHQLSDTDPVVGL